MRLARRFCHLITCTLAFTVDLDCVHLRLFIPPSSFPFLFHSPRIIITVHPFLRKPSGDFLRLSHLFSLPPSFLLKPLFRFWRTPEFSLRIFCLSDAYFDSTTCPEPIHGRSCNRFL